MSGVLSISVPSKSVGRSYGHAPGAFAQPKSIQKATMIYTHVPKRGPVCMAVLWIDFEAILGVLMPIRISCRDK